MALKLIEFFKWLLGLFVKPEESAKIAPPPKKADGILVLIVGHNARAMGAYGVAPLSMSEYPYNKNLVAPECERYAATLGFATAVLLKDGQTTKSVGAKATTLVRNHKKGVVVELHFNAAGGASGTETLYNSARPSNKEFAALIQKKMVEVFGKEDRGLKLRDVGRGAANLAAVKETSVLVEPLFGDVIGDATLLKDKYKEYAKAIVDSAVEFLK